MNKTQKYNEVNITCMEIVDFYVQGNRIEVKIGNREKVALSITPIVWIRYEQQSREKFSIKLN